MTADSELRAEIVRVGKLMHQFELVDGASGNISARLDSNRLLATPSGLAKGFLSPEQLIVVDMEGELIPPAPPGLKPTSELLMHLEAYKQRPDVNGVVHAHPITAVALSIVGIPLTDCVIPESVMLFGAIPTTPYANPSSAENQRAISELVKTHDAIVLAYHGSLTVGPTVWEAYLRLESLEHTAKIIAQARVLGTVKPLPPEQVAKIISTRQQWGFARATDAEEFCKYCGVCHASGQHRDEEALIRAVAEEVKNKLQVSNFQSQTSNSQT
ncbi:MAG: class II aldolase/adducin family protein [Chloroflexi bacterium]|nr:class II aldolase/adducin family protein [Chloroflexota bacterium]